MGVKLFLLNLVLTALLTVPAFASKVVEDSQSRFVLDDEVTNTAAHRCNSSKGEFYQPENAHYYDGNGVPFRIYRVALPNQELPLVSVLDDVLLDLKKPVCGDPELKEDVIFDFLPVQSSEAYLSDGLWLTDIRVPLYVKKGNSVALRQKFRLNVQFSGKGSGLKPGARGLARARNVNGASRFAVSQKAFRKSLRKSADESLDDVGFLAQFFVAGDKNNVGSFATDGLYAVDFKTIRTSLLSSKLLDSLSGIPVEKICLYGAVPDTLASAGPGSAERNPNQIFEIPIEIRDHSPSGDKGDGVFGMGDTLVFVGYGNGFWKRCDRQDSSFVNGKMDYYHSYSPYSVNQGFLFGRKHVGKGLRLSGKVKAAAGTGRDVEWMRYVRAEKDAILRDTYYGKDLYWESSTGKEWFWKWHSRLETLHVDASELRTEETKKLPGLIDGGRQYVALTYMPRRSLWTSNAEVRGDQVRNMTLSAEPYAVRMDSIDFAVDVNGTYVYRKQTSLIPGGNFRVDGIKLKKSDNSISLDMLPNPSQYDRFDGYTLAYQWKPEVDSAEWLLPGSVSGLIRIPVPSGTQVMKFRNFHPEGYLESSNGYATDSVSVDDDVRYLAVRSNVFRKGLKVEKLNVNQGSLKNLANPDKNLEYLIVAPPDFVDDALRLAEFRSSGQAVSTIATSVVNVDDIYRMYTAGRSSPVAIRNYLSYVKSIRPDFQYVLLVGSANFDYRGMNSRLSANLLPVFEQEDCVTEDFYGVLDSGEVIRFGQYDLDVAVGRIPAQSVASFAAYVQKVKEHEKLKELDNSSWRSTLLLAADDAENNGGTDDIAHTEFQENTARVISEGAESKNLQWIMKKVYLLDYEADASGQKKGAKDDFLNILNQGALFTTYYGHGSKTDWAAEGLLKPGYIPKLTNKGRYTVLASFSCTVGRFDEGTTLSLSEEMMLAEGAGSIASIGASRETFASENRNWGMSFMRNALTSDNVRFIGDALVMTKRQFGREYSSHRYNAERYALLGEPVISLPSAKHKIKLDNPIKELKALDKMTLSGTVSGLENGFINFTLREGRQYKMVDLMNSSEDSVEVFYDGSLIYSEEVPVKNGHFSTDFVTPRKISIGDSLAEFSAWAYSKNSPSIGRLWKGHLKITGVSDYADSLKDTIPPTIKMSPCYEGPSATSFADGQVVRLSSPACLQVEVEDVTALDFREQADEGISFEIVGVQDPFHPWPYLEQNSKYAKLRMNFPTETYPAGRYEFKVRAMDVVGNMAVKTVNVEITEKMEAGLADVYNVPNPMGKKGTTFYFKNLAADRISKVNIFIYSQNGRLVKVLKNAQSGITRWDGRDEHGRLLANGLYHYVVRNEVSASGDNDKKTWTKKQKLLISR